MRKFDFPVHSPTEDVTLSVLAFLPSEGEPTALVEIAHGMAEHKERYEAFADYLCDEGFAVIIHDMRGHGGSVRSEEELGYFSGGGYMSLIRDFGAVRDAGTNVIASHMKGDPQKLPYIVLGHSMGSLVANLYARRNDKTVDALIEIGFPTAYKDAKMGAALSSLLMKLGEKKKSNFINAMSFSSFDKRLGGKPGDMVWITSDEVMLERYNNDPLCGFTFTREGFNTLFTLLYEVHTGKGTADHPDMPIRFFSGQDDPCTDGKLEEAVEMMKKRGYRDVSYKYYPDMRHEILNERGRGEVMSNIAEFIHELVD
ncbi:MAG: alpha/beta hydrolase [Clostridia bacterium]|nr:alpha/beta hydrolase [Clostridia bacterium]